MAAITKQHLQEPKYRYNWEPNLLLNDRNFTMSNANLVIDKKNGVQVLAFIEYILNTFNIIHKDSVSKIEDLIHTSKTQDFLKLTISIESKLSCT
jgi:hypothetical protein